MAEFPLHIRIGDALTLYGKAVTVVARDNITVTSIDQYMRLVNKWHAANEAPPTADPEAKIDELRRVIHGWHKTALAIRDATIFLWTTKKKVHYDAMEKIFMDAALLRRWYLGAYSPAPEDREPSPLMKLDRVICQIEAMEEQARHCKDSSTTSYLECYAEAHVAEVLRVVIAKLKTVTEI
jgi:hypothetical protein